MKGVNKKAFFNDEMTVEEKEKIKLEMSFADVLTDMCAVGGKISAMNSTDSLFKINFLEKQLVPEAWKNVPCPVFNTIVDVCGRMKDVKIYVRNLLALSNAAHSANMA